jgi:hypothetical protein
MRHLKKSDLPKDDIRRLEKQVNVAACCTTTETLTCTVALRYKRLLINISTKWMLLSKPKHKISSRLDAVLVWRTLSRVSRLFDFYKLSNFTKLPLFTVKNFIETVVVTASGWLRMNSVITDVL